MNPQHRPGSTTSLSHPVLAQSVPGTRSAAAAIAAGCIALAVGACSEDTGYVEIRTGLTPSSVLPALYLDSVRFEPRRGTTVLRQPVGTTELETDAGGQMILLCDVVVKKNRITTVTVSFYDRPPRCQCRTDMTTEPHGGRVCVG